MRWRAARDRRGAQAIEYLTTWTIAIVVLFITAAILVYSGVLKLPTGRSGCQSGPEIDCIEQEVFYDADAGASYVRVQVQTNAKEAGTYTATATAASGATANACFFDPLAGGGRSASAILRPRDDAIVTCRFDGERFVEDEQASVAITMTLEPQHGGYARNFDVGVASLAQQKALPGPLTDDPEDSRDEHCTDGIDNDGDGQRDLADTDCCPDNDGDGYVRDRSFCVGGPFNQPGWLEGDCDDDDAGINPAAAEVCANGVDDDCDTDVDEGCAPSCDDLCGAGGWEDPITPGTCNGLPQLCWGPIPSGTGHCDGRCCCMGPVSP